MTETTGGHYLDTGTGPRPLTLAAQQAADGAEREAYREYIEHRPGCQACDEAAFQCEDAAALWQAYRDVRATR